MLDYKQAELFKDLVLTIGCMGSEQFELMCREAWATRWEHFNNKYWNECRADPWEFIVSLDSIALGDLVNWYNKRRGAEHP